MSNKYFNRYGQFKSGSDMSNIPFIRLSSKPTDISTIYNQTKRLDVLSQKYYGTPYYGWLIMMANPEYGGLEFDIPENTTIRIPFPLMDTLKEYQNKLDKYIELNGNE
jgi:hypothetical protein